MSSATFLFHSEVEGTRPLQALEGQFTATGWCLDELQPSAPAVRLVAASLVLPQTEATVRRDVPTRFPAHPAAAKCGFVIRGEIPAGVHLARLEAKAADGSWHILRTLSIAVRPRGFMAKLDRPIAAGTLRDRVRVGGWALHPQKPIASLALRYGHRELPCQLGLKREDAAELLPEVPSALGSGFESSDFLVAGVGPVRIKARFTDGTMAVATTSVRFAVLTDENHGESLGLDGERAPLPRPGLAAHPAAAPEREPLNLLYVLHGSFASNSALHVAALANELAGRGHRAAVAVPHDAETLSHHESPSFRGLTFAEALRDPGFPQGRGPDVIHAWTTREHVRAFTEQLRAKWGARVVVHLEDNERELLALAASRTISELEALPDGELDRLVPADLSHPRRGPAFLASADAATVIVDTLRDFVPSGLPCATIPPAADARYFRPLPRPDDFRRILDIAPDSTVLFYHGNIHASNAREMRELYAAVARLNEEGCPVTLIRTGLDRVDHLGAWAERTRPHVLELGQILHHRHLPALLSLADIFVQPGADDAFNRYRFPSKLPEFFAIGRPVVLPRTNLGAALRHGTDAYVLDTANADGIVRAVRELRRDRALRERLAHGAAEYARSNFDWGRSAGRLAGFYREVLALPRR